MSEDRHIPTHLWVEAKIRELSAAGTGVYVARRGNKTGGLVLLKISDMGGQCRLLTQQRDLDGKLGWAGALSTETVPENEADAYIARATDRDPDLWVIEVEDREMQNPFADEV